MFIKDFKKRHHRHHLKIFAT